MSSGRDFHKMTRQKAVASAARAARDEEHLLSRPIRSTAKPQESFEMIVNRAMRIEEMLERRESWVTQSLQSVTDPV